MVLPTRSKYDRQAVVGVHETSFIPCVQTASLEKLAALESRVVVRRIVSRVHHMARLIEVSRFTWSMLLCHFGELDFINCNMRLEISHRCSS